MKRISRLKESQSKAVGRSSRRGITGKSASVSIGSSSRAKYKLSETLKIQEKFGAITQKRAGQL